MEKNKWDSTELDLYLLYENWAVKNGLAVLVGQKYNSADERIHFRKTMQEESVSALSANRYERLCRLWEHSNHREENFLLRNPNLLLCECRPVYIIQWALSKGFRPDWLDWAIEHDLYTLKQETEIPCHAETSPAYSTSWLSIQQAAIVEFFNPRRKPDAKRDEIVEWINKKAKAAGLSGSDNIAKAIFTIIKPSDHDPKNKRVESLD